MSDQLGDEPSHPMRRATDGTTPDLLTTMIALRDDLTEQREQWRREKRLPLLLAGMAFVASSAALGAVGAVWWERGDRVEAICENRQAIRDVIVAAIGGSGSEEPIPFDQVPGFTEAWDPTEQAWFIALGELIAGEPTTVDGQLSPQVIRLLALIPPCA